MFSILKLEVVFIIERSRSSLFPISLRLLFLALIFIPPLHFLHPFLLHSSQKSIAIYILNNIFSTISAPNNIFEYTSLTSQSFSLMVISLQFLTDKSSELEKLTNFQKLISKYEFSSQERIFTACN